LLLAAEALWVAGVGSLAANVVPHARERLDVSPRTVVLLLAGSCLVAVVFAIAAGRRPPGNRRAALLVAVIVLGSGLLATTVGISAPGLGTALVLTAVALGAAARFGYAELMAVSVPASGRAAALLTGAASLAVAVPLARLVGDGSERLAFTLGGFAALLAAVPVLRLGGAAAPWLVRAVVRRAAAYVAATGALLLLAVAIHRSALLDLDTAALEALHELDATSGLVDSLFVAPSLRNYVIILAVVALVGARLWGRTTPGRTLLISAGAACVAYAGVRGCWAIWERPRPEEVLATAPVTDRSWAPYPSFPSGHMAVTTSLALVTAALVPKLRFVLWGYAAIIAFTRMSYGAHFPSDVLLGAVLGWLAYRVTVTPLRPPDGGRSTPAAVAAAEP
jgi:undecaprenyl-diphosphatase